MCQRENGRNSAPSAANLRRNCSQSLWGVRRFCAHMHWHTPAEASRNAADRPAAATELKALAGAPKRPTWQQSFSLLKPKPC